MRSGSAACALRVLWPRQPVPTGDDPNNWATVIHARYGEVDALLTADAESNVTLPLRPPQAEVLKVAHHGSADPGLERAAACGPAADRAHLGRCRQRLRAPDAIDRRDARRAVRASRSTAPTSTGAITVESDGRRIEVRSER